MPRTRALPHRATCPPPHLLQREAVAEHAPGVGRLPVQAGGCLCQLGQLHLALAVPQNGGVDLETLEAVRVHLGRAEGGRGIVQTSTAIAPVQEHHGCQAMRSMQPGVG